MTQATIEETYGKLLLSDLFTHIWFGDWDQYETIIAQLPEGLTSQLPFHEYYDRKETAMWYDNYFRIPGPYFIPPYLSSYAGKSGEDQDKARQDVLCLVGEYDKLGFYYPLDKNEFPDHFGSITAFVTAALREETKATQVADQVFIKQLKKAQTHVIQEYLLKGIYKMNAQCEERLTDSFFKAFMSFFIINMEEIIE